MSTDDDFPQPHLEWDNDFCVFKDTENSTKSGVPHAYNEDGEKLNGFANPYYDKKYRNKNGRPRTRDKTKLANAQNSIDSFANMGVRTLRQFAENKYIELGYENPIPPKLRFDALKYLLDKAISNEKDKLMEEITDLKAEKKKPEEDTVEEDDFSVGNLVDFPGKN